MFCCYLFSIFTITLVCCASFVFYFHYHVGVLRFICFLLSLIRWFFCALFVFHFHYYVGILRTVCFLLSLLRWCFAHYLFSTLTITLVFCALFVFFSNYNVGVLCTIFFYLYYYVGVLRTICFLLSLLRWCFTHYFFSTFTIRLVFCATFVFCFR